MTDEVIGAAGANQTMDAGVAAQNVTAAEAAAAPDNPNVGQGLAKIEPSEADQTGASDAQAKPAADAAPEVVAPTVDEMAAKRNAENLERAIEKGGYKPEAEPSREERARTLVADMEHTVANNGPITIAMMKEVRDLLGV